MIQIFSSMSKSPCTLKSATCLYEALKILGKWEILANSQLFKPTIAHPAATERAYIEGKFSVKAGKARLGLNSKFTNFKPPSPKYKEGF